ncbi:anti-sigma regulatory factor (Ser/Thr protein kinase) [Nocardiopsis sp. Huas11]|uniref:ATP-binding protein n=1 Tax=Nocardiopsis sp. Huas11 TaxID=2183912 RepID=UPI000EAB8F14|nr:ATP-binding protein [Nocardiopsis sp. Huas11]RKS05461.1 anti-sigma regulatory factor (Ser/Thr protein kinase) [Nocardiopsis sp. Huas11]
MNREISAAEPFQPEHGRALAFAPPHNEVLWRGRTSFPGVPTSVGEARTWLHARLTTQGIEPPENIGLILSELATNAVHHTQSGLPGGRFAVRLLIHPDRLRLEVRDGGPLGNVHPLRRPAPDALAEHGRGLVLVNSFAPRWGRLTNGHGMYAEVDR